MKVLLKNATIICSASPFHGMKKDIVIEDGIIQSFLEPSNQQTADQVVSIPNLHVSLGWMDLFAQFHDPGQEHKEDLHSGAATAAAGGFTDVMLVPNTHPTISSKTQVEYWVQAAKSLPVHIHPIAAATQAIEGKQLAEMYDMHRSGAVAFSDGMYPLQPAAVLLKALQYIKAIDANLIQLPGDASLTAQGLMNEGVMSTQLGLPGIPAMAEEIMIARDIELLRYTNSKLHITGISTLKSLELIEQAKKEGLKISCSVSPAHLNFCDEDLQQYDTHLKIYPPLRTRQDMMALRDAFANNRIDGIASHHLPQHADDKDCEFEYAKPGMISLQTLFSSTLEMAKDLSQLIDILTINNRSVFGLPVPEMEVGARACLTLFDPNQTYTFDEKTNRSKSGNSPYLGKELLGKPLGIFHKNKLTLHE